MIYYYKCKKIPAQNGHTEKIPAQNVKGNGSEYIMALVLRDQQS